MGLENKIYSEPILQIKTVSKKLINNLDDLEIIEGYTMYIRSGQTIDFNDFLTRFFLYYGTHHIAADTEALTELEEWNSGGCLQNFTIHVSKTFATAFNSAMTDIDASDRAAWNCNYEPDGNSHIDGEVEPEDVDIMANSFVPNATVSFDEVSKTEYEVLKLSNNIDKNKIYIIKGDDDNNAGINDYEDKFKELQTKIYEIIAALETNGITL